MVDRDCPNVCGALSVLPEVPGWSNWMRLNTLYTSARNCTLTRSVMCVFFIRFKLVLKYLAPVKVFLPKFPGLPKGWTANALIGGPVWFLGAPAGIAGSPTRS